MKIIEDSPTRLVVEDRPWGLGAILIVFILAALYGSASAGIDGEWPEAALLLGLAGLVYWALGKFVRLGQLTLDKSAASATWATRSSVRSARHSWPLGETRRAVVETRYDEGETYRITLLFDGGREPLPLTPYFSGMGRHEMIKERINDFLAASQ